MNKQITRRCEAAAIAADDGWAFAFIIDTPSMLGNVFSPQANFQRCDFKTTTKRWQSIPIQQSRQIGPVSCDMSVTKSTANLLYFFHTRCHNYFRLNLDSLLEKAHENHMNILCCNNSNRSSWTIFLCLLSLWCSYCFQRLDARKSELCVPKIQQLKVNCPFWWRCWCACVRACVRIWWALHIHIALKH